MLLTTGRPDLGFKLSLALDEVPFPLKKPVVLLDPNLLLDKKVAAVVQSAFYQFQMVS